MQQQMLIATQVVVHVLMDVDHRLHHLLGGQFGGCGGKGGREKVAAVHA